MDTKLMAAGEFKAKCLSVMDEVRDKRTSVMITKNGAPVAKLVPIAYGEETDPIFGFYKGKIEIVEDISEPVYTSEENEEFYHRKDAMYGPIRKSVAK